MKENIKSNNKRIAKNTLMLYLRMIIVTIISLITVKYTLSILGIDNYGIYNVVGGVVTLFSFMTGSLNSATQRFLAFDLGKEDYKSYNDTFNMTLLTYVIMGISILIIFEFLGYHIIYKWLSIPSGSLNKAYVVYQISICTFIVNLMIIPFSSCIIANERMGVYAYISIIEALSKLVILFFLYISPFNKLITYSLLVLLATLFIDSIYIWYCLKKIGNIKIYYIWDRARIKKISSYTGWNLMGSLSSTLNKQGLGIVMNLFFGVTANAAKAISDKITTIVFSFIRNFYMAISPQIVKTYAAKDYSYTINLAFKSTKLAYYLMFLLTAPVIILLEKVLRLWLTGDFTMDMLVFTRLSLIFTLVNVFEAPITFMVIATGDIKKYQICIGAFTLTIIPISYVLYKIGYPVYTGYVVEILVYVFVQFIRVIIAKKYYDFTIKSYFMAAVLQPIALTFIIVCIAIFCYQLNFSIYLIAFIIELASLLFIWFLGLVKSEKQIIIDFIKKYIYHAR